MANEQLEELRKQLDDVNLQLLDLINERARVAQEIGKVKSAQGSNRFDPVRERDMLDTISENNAGPFETSTLQHIFKEIFKASLELQEDDHSKALLVSRKKHPDNTIIDLNNVPVGNGTQQLIAGPCSVENEEQVDAVAKAIKEQGIPFLRGGAFKPRTSPYDFQGLGIEGLEILRRVADRHDLTVISEIVNPADLEKAVEYLDVVQIGARNMQNFELLKAAGDIKTPVLLKRGLSATIQEFMNAAEYVLAKGNDQVMLCERGIRTYEKATRNTLDISAVPILKQETHLPVWVDVTHSTGRRDLLLPAAKAALAIGADGVMTEVHPDPAVALSDSAQQMDIPQFNEFMEALRTSGYLQDVRV
ncbi:bifunctional 3-deoxy-7-phosphoheptulonate synthase/chorismate mutase [Texcoconibacillus texcoconensis]|uniref:3-deoxy-7-phosphoheptulonate synthase/chorismate mutase n=1 Tax=Texcoconibacillus texcoconensis TaxID=1095777 RepID=A0A840QN15_9BACI|nr:bifunctional 3-deoxy-7-phosphoheptulonate synthase/chorismate mutase [Texcoconibacillus texcoconensis]MBB5172775.1 3-deoxy-7-phosphoheptulonate synthase/chorismate mutase [Texcoconibacillus texcoconensis]